MIFLNRFKLRLYVLLSTIIFHSSVFSLTKICLAGSDVATLPSYGYSFLNGAKLAQMQSTGGERVKIVPYFYDRQPLEAIRIYEKMQKDGCNAIVGFDSLTDVKIIAQLQKPPYIPVFTTNASTMENEKVPNNFFIAMPSYDFLAKNMLAFLTKNFGQLNNILLVTEVNRNEMLDYKTVYSSQLRNYGIKYDAFDFLEGDTNAAKKINEMAKKNKYNYIFVFATANDGSAIANANDNKNTIYIGTEFFGSSVTPSFHLRLKDGEAKAYIIRNLDFSMKNKKLEQFQKSYYQQYNINPSVLSLYAYDEVSLLIKSTLKNNEINAGNVLDINYNGVTGIQVKNNIFYRSKNYVILKNINKGYQYVQ